MGTHSQEIERLATDALASAGDVINPWDTPIQAVSAALGKTFDESRILVGGMAARRVVQLERRRGTVKLHPDPSPTYLWKPGPTPPGGDQAPEPKGK